jgi:hypothetical protein
MDSGSNRLGRPHLHVVRDADADPAHASFIAEATRDSACHCDHIPVLLEALMHLRVDIAKLRERLLLQLQDQAGPIAGSEG